MKINTKIKFYIETNLFPQYKKNEEGHGLNHIQYVIRRSFEIIKQNNLQVDDNMVYVIEVYMEK